MVLNFINWNVAPEIFKFGGFEVRWYGLLFALAFLVSYYIMKNMFNRENVKQDLLDKLTIYVGLGTVIGARLGHVLFYQPDYYAHHLLEVIQIWKGGLASHGAAIGIVIALWLFVRKYKKPYLWIMDKVVVVVAISGAFVRLGNLMNSEIFGIPTTVPWAFIFERIDNIPRHPTQIYEALSYFLIFGILIYLYYKKEAWKKQGYIFGIFLILLFTSRFFIEFIKDKQVDFEQTLPIDMGQILSIPFILTGFYILYRVIKKNKTT